MITKRNLSYLKEHKPRTKSDWLVLGLKAVLILGAVFILFMVFRGCVAITFSPDHDAIGRQEDLYTKPASINPFVKIVPRNNYKTDHGWWDGIKVRWEFLNKQGYEVTRIEMKQYKYDGLFNWVKGDYKVALIYYELKEGK